MDNLYVGSFIFHNNVQMMAFPVIVRDLSTHFLDYATLDCR